MRIAFFYFIFISTTGLLLPYFPKYLDALGFSGTRIARVNSIGPILLVFVPLLWGFIADKTGRTALLLKVACAGAAFFLAVIWLGNITAYGAILIVWFMYSFFQSPLLPLADSLAIIEARRIGTDYARLRLWGSISFIAVSFGFGQYLNYGGDIRLLPLLAACLAGAAALAVHLLRQHDGGSRRRPPSFRDARKLLHNPGLIWFFIASMVHQTALSPYYLFYSIHLEKRGLGQGIVGWSFLLGVSAEVTMFWFARPLFDRRPLFRLMAISFIISAVRWWLTARLTSGPLMAALQTCHAFTFALCYAGAIAHLEKNVAEPLRATGRALFSAIAMGMGGLIGHTIAGWVGDRFGSATAFQVAAGLEIAALAPLFIAAKYTAQRHVAPEELTATEMAEAHPIVVE